MFNNVKNMTKIGLSMAGKDIKGAPKKIVKSSVIDVKDKKTGEVKKNLGNLYTGKKINPKHLAIGGTAVIGGQYLAAAHEQKTTGHLKLATMNNYAEIGAPEIMNYDGVGQQKAPSDLNAHGSLVFGLHNGRKG